MPILLAQLAVDAMVATLRLHLPTQLLATELDFDVSISVPPPPDAAYYKRMLKMSATQGYETQVEVFEESYGFLFPQADIADGRVAYELPLTVRLTHLNQDALDADALEYRKRMYVAALVNVLRVRHQLGVTDESIKVVLPTLIDATVDSAESGTSKVTVTLRTMVQCEEGP